MKHYSEEDKKYIFENYTKISPSAIARHLGRTENAIDLFVHRHKNDPRMIQRDNLLVRVLKSKFSDPSLFNPNRAFFDAVRIGQKRFWSLYKGSEIMTNEECMRIADYLEISLEGVFISRQGNLFEEETTK
ncbi:MAG: XRE family transcriptional regulator [Bacteroidales bacterium]|nr:XRE family transcriptional regulator [Bacteroidales bacterium]